MSASPVLALLQGVPANTPQHESAGPILWWWIVLAAVGLVLFFILAFRRRDLPHDEVRREEPGPLERHDREVYP